MVKFMCTYTCRDRDAHLIVSSASVAHDVHNHIALEYLSILSRQTAHSNHLSGCWCGMDLSLGIQCRRSCLALMSGLVGHTDLIYVVAVDVENRRTDGLRNTSLTCMHNSKPNAQRFCASIGCTHRVDGGSGHSYVSCEPNLEEVQRIAWIAELIWEDPKMRNKKVGEGCDRLEPAVDLVIDNDVDRATDAVIFQF